MSRKLLLVLLVTATVGALAFVGIGCEMCCNSSQGSGSIVITDPGSGPNHKATFSYRVECVGSYAEVDANRTVSGRLEYQDHVPWKRNGSKADSVSIHGSVDDVYTVDDGVCSQTQNLAIFTGHYSPQPANLGEGGTFTIRVEDNGKPGPSPDDTFEILLEGGVFDQYHVGGVLAGGNIKSL